MTWPMAVVGRLVAAVLMAAVATMGIVAGTASAHASLVSSDPADGARLDSVPHQVGLVFNEDIDPSLSQVIVNSGGIARDAPGVATDGRRVSAQIPSDVTSGEVSVLYKIVSADGHPVSGRITFTVTAAGSTAPAATSTAAPTTASPARPAAEDSSDTGNAMMVALTVIAAVVLVVVGILIVRAERRRR